MKPAAFQATIHGFRTVPSRGVVSITIEAPIEHHAEIARIAVHGAWVAVARLEEQKEDIPIVSRDETEKPAKEKAHWRDLTPTAQAILRCKEPIFLAFLRDENYYCDTQDQAAEIVRQICGVKSRSNLATNHAARMIWHQLDEKYQAWRAMERAS